MVLVNIDFPCSQWGATAPLQGDPYYPRVSTKLAGWDIFSPMSILGYKFGLDPSVLNGWSQLG